MPTKPDGRDRTPLLAGRANRPYTTTGLHRLVATAAKLPGIGKLVSPQWLWHLFAALAAVGGAPPYQLQADLGHAWLETSQRYVHWAKVLAESAVDRLPIRHLVQGEGRFQMSLAGTHRQRTDLLPSKQVVADSISVSRSNPDKTLQRLQGEGRRKAAFCF